MRLKKSDKESLKAHIFKIRRANLPQVTEMDMWRIVSEVRAFWKYLLTRIYSCKLFEQLNATTMFSLLKTPSKSLKLDVFDKYIAAYMLLIYARLGRLKLKRFSVTFDGFQINECVKNNNGLVGKTQLCACISLFCTFLCSFCTTTTWNCLILPF